jgi:hypothetical protein
MIRFTIRFYDQLINILLKFCGKKRLKDEKKVTTNIRLVVKYVQVTLPKSQSSLNKLFIIN